MIDSYSWQELIRKDGPDLDAQRLMLSSRPLYLRSLSLSSYRSTVLVLEKPRTWPRDFSVTSRGLEDLENKEMTHRFPILRSRLFACCQPILGPKLRKS